MLPVLFRKVSQSDRPPLPESTDAAIQQIVKQSWLGNSAAPRSFEDILEALRRIWFMMAPAGHMRKVSEFVALVEPSGPGPRRRQMSLFSLPRRQLPRRGSHRAVHQMHLSGPGGGVRGVQCPHSPPPSAPAHARSNPIGTSVARAANNAFDSIHVNSKNMPRRTKTGTIC
jgi:hypothetical protein